MATIREAARELKKAYMEIEQLRSQLDTTLEQNDLLVEELEVVGRVISASNILLDSIDAAFKVDDNYGEHWQIVDDDADMLGEALSNYKASKPPNTQEPK